MLESTVSSRGPAWAHTLKLFSPSPPPPFFLSVRGARVATRVATTSSARDFLAGDAHGTASPRRAGSSSGCRSVIGPARYVRRRCGLAAASDSAGRVFVATEAGWAALRLRARRPARAAVRGARIEPHRDRGRPDGAVVCASSPSGKVYRFDARQSRRRRTVLKRTSRRRPCGRPEESAIGRWLSRRTARS